MISSTIMMIFSDFHEHSSENEEELDEIEDEKVDDEEELYHSAYVACQTMMKWLRVYGWTQNLKALFCHEHKPWKRSGKTVNKSSKQ